MPNLLPLSRAARLAGVTRGDLQRRIRAGELATFEGEINIFDLIKVFPEINLAETKMLEKVRNIKANARPKRNYEESIPSAEILVSRLKKISYDLFHSRTDVTQLEQLLNEVKSKLANICIEPDCDPKEQIKELTSWLDSAVENFTHNAKDCADVHARDALVRIMAAHIKILPSGHEFFLEGQETLLDASISAGLHVNYGCSSGNCGACKARLIEGEVHQIRNHDYKISEHEKNLGYLLMCSNTAVTDVVLEAGEAVKASDIPQQKIRSTIRKTETLADDLMILHLQTPRSRTLRFMAGQNIRLTFNDGVSAVYPISSCPCDGRNLQIIVRNKPDDPFTQKIFNDIDRTENVEINGPEGDFVLRQDRNESKKPLLFIAVEDGFAPIRSLCEHTISIDNAESVHLIRVTRSTDKPFLNGLCRSWRDALDNFDCTNINSGWDMQEISKIIREQHPITSDLLVFIAGPVGEKESIIQQLSELGIPKKNINIRQE